MKKYWAGVIAVLVFIPVIIAACRCCPLKAAGGEELAFRNSHHRCCTLFDARRDDCNLQKKESNLQASLHSELVRPGFENAGVTALNVKRRNFASVIFFDTGPPGKSAKPPLYLAFQTLRF